MNRNASVEVEGGLSRLRRRAPRVLVVFGVLLAAVAIVGDWTGFGWISGPAAIGAIGAALLAFALFSSLPAATGGDAGDQVPNVSGNTDSE